MRQISQRHQGAAERTVKDIRRKTRRRYSSEDKIRIVLAGTHFRLCRNRNLRLPF
ncbi:MAG: IS3 family transposase, partial [Alphaproteobacteria bacterium]|nr:IS3 family transposase [Alphaproteobacteria bacterium]